MNNNKMIYGMFGALVGGVLVWFLAIYAVNSDNTGMMRMMGVPNNTQNSTQDSQKSDSHFIEQMIPHHEDAIAMAEIALVKAQRPEVKILAENIIKAQRSENEQMRAWYKSWLGAEVPESTQVMDMHGMGTGMHMGLMGDETDVEALKNATDFEKEFIEQMIPHHQMAVMMANMLKVGTTRTEMKQLSENIITTQTDEINQMREWYSDWGY